MANIGPQPKPSLQALGAAAGTSPDLVELWKAHVRTSFGERAPNDRAQLDARLRRTRGIVFFALAFGLVSTLVTRHGVPLVRFALMFVALSASRAAYEAFKDRHDERAGVVRNSNAARAELAAGHATQAIAIARAALGVARSTSQKRALWATIAWSAISEREPFLAHLALQNLPVGDIDVHLLAAYLGCCNRGSEAEDLLREARAAGQRSPESSKQLIELSFARGDTATVRALADADADLLSEKDLQAIALALRSPIGPMRGAAPLQSPM
jgi:hypothetical protein